jgi:hypothetical protein
MRIVPILFLFLGLFSFACEDNSDDKTSSGTPPAAGLWQIHYFDSNKKDETSNYKGYTFEFKSNGDFIATKANVITKGTWSTTCDNSKNKLCLSFPSNASSELGELSEDWILIKNESDFIHLEDLNSKGEKTTVHLLK